MTSIPMPTDNDFNEKTHTKILRRFKMTREIKTRPNEFKRFHALLTATTSFKPWYFKLTKHDKDPLTDVSWKVPKSKLTPIQALHWMEAGYNVGVAATNMDPLVIIDIDDIDKTPDSDIQSTLSVKSRKRMGMHYFYITKDAKCKVNIPTDEYGEMRAMWQYVVAPGSYVETDDDLISAMPDSEIKYAGYYTLFNKVKPTYIEYNNIPDIFRREIKRQEDNTKARADNKAVVVPASKLYDLTVRDIFNISGKRNRFASMFHNSKTGKNTSIDGDWIICWRHNVSHNSLSSLAVMSGMANCQDAGWGHDNSGIGPSQLNFKDGKVIYELWKFAKAIKLIPEDDLIPIAARRYLRGRS